MVKSNYNYAQCDLGDYEYDIRRNCQAGKTEFVFLQEAFSKEFNVNVTTVSRWETEKSKPNMFAMRQIKEFYTKYYADYDSLESCWLAFEQEK